MMDRCAPGASPSSAGADAEARTGLDALDVEALRRMLDASWDMQALYDLAGNFVAVSAASARLFGWAPEELIGTSSYEYFHPDDLAAIRAAHDHVLDADLPAFVTYRLRCKDGSYRWVEVVGVGIHRTEPGGPELIHCTTREITERHRLEEENDRIAAELRDREERYRLTQEHSGVGMALVDLDGSWLDVNPAICRLLGRSREQLLATTFQAITYPDDLGADLDEMQALLDGVSDGYTMDKRYLRPDGSVVHAQLHGTIVRDTVGRPRYFVAQVLDLSDRVRAEEAERSIERTHRHQMVGRLAATIAHEFNNLLAEMSMNVELLEGEIAGRGGFSTEIDESSRRLLRLIRTATDVTRGLQVIGGAEPTSDRDLDLRAVAREAGDHLDQVLGPDVVIELQTPGDACWIHGDPERITTALLALLVNSSEALPSGGRINVDVRRRPAVELPSREGTASAAHGWVTVSVTDEGVGMTTELLERVVEPYFSTRQGQLGTGLTVARHVVESAGGLLELQSTPGHGTTITLWFPERHVDSVAASSVADAPALTVLVVDDRPELSALMERTLRRAGLAVHTMNDPGEALRSVQSGDLQVDVIVTDLVMPSMSGVDLASGVRETHPRLGIVFISGYSGLGDEVSSVEGARFLAKPFPTKDLLEAVHAVHAWSRR